MHIKLIITRKALQLASFWKWGFLELGNGLFKWSLGNESLTNLVWTATPRVLVSVLESLSRFFKLVGKARALSPCELNITPTLHRYLYWTIKPVLSGQPWGTAYWPRNAGWPFKKGLTNQGVIQQNKDRERAKYGFHGKLTPKCFNLFLRSIDLSPWVTT